jgi:hypothetical protein
MSGPTDPITPDDEPDIVAVVADVTVGAEALPGHTLVRCVACGREGQVPTEMLPPEWLAPDGSGSGLCPRCTPPWLRPVGDP